MSILNVNQIQPVGGGSTITVSANDVNFSGNISIGSSFVGTASTASLATSAQGLTGTPDITVGNIQSGVVTATTFIGDGSGLTGVTASGSGINIKDSGSTVGVAATIDFSTNLNVSPASAGIVTVTVGDTDFSIADKIVHTGDTNTAIRFPSDDTVTVETAGSEALRITSNNKIGIDSTSPHRQLVVGDGGDISCFGTNGGIYFGTDTGGFRNNGAIARAQQNNYHVSGSQVGDLVMAPEADKDLIFSSGSTNTMYERLRITTGGNIGIGENNPQNPLHISGSSTAIRFEDSGANGSAFSIIEDNDGLFKIRNDAGNSGTGSGIVFEVDAAERLRINSSGNIGIATTNPSDHNNFSRALDINGPSGAAVYMRTAGSSTNTFIVGNYGSDAYLNNVANGNIRFYTQGDERLRIDSSGNVNIGMNGSSNPFNYLRFGASQYGAADIRPTNEASHKVGLAFYVDGTQDTTINPVERLRIDSSGRVGINTNTFNDAAEALRVQAPSGQNNTHLTIKAGSTSGYSVLNFGDDDFNEGRIKYDHSSNTMEFFADDAGFMKYEDDNTVGGGRWSLTSNGTYLTANTVDYYINAGSTRTYGVYVHKNNTGGTYGLYCYTLGGNSTQYSIGGQADTSSTYSSGGGLFYSINSNTYGIVGYWSGSAYYTIYGNGVSLCTGGHTTSDARLKDVQSGIGTGILDKVCSLEAKKYTWKENTQQRRSVGVGTQIGLLAQDVLEHFPEVVMEHENPEIAGHNPETLNEQIGTTYSIDYGKMTAVLIEAIKDLKAENNALAARVAALEGS